MLKDKQNYRAIRMSGKKGRKRIVPQDWELMELDNVEDDDSEDVDFKPSTRVDRIIWKSDEDGDDDDDNDDNDADSGDESSDDDDDDGGDDSDAHSSSEESDESDIEDDDISGDDEDHAENEVGSNHVDKKNQGKTPKKDRSSIKTSSNISENEERHNADCPICLIEFTDQLVGQPENCQHLFCLDCIKEWSKNVNSCPLDRKQFNNLKIKKDKDGQVIEELFIEDVWPAAEEFEEPPTFCQICNMCDREDVMLLCDGCDEGYHIDCLTPSLDHVPIDDWYCPRCSMGRQPKQNQAAASVTQCSPRITRRRGVRTVAESATFARAARAWFSGEVDANLSTFIGYRPRAAKRRSRSKKGKRKTKRKSTRKIKDGNEIGSRAKRKKKRVKKSKKGSSQKKAAKGKEKGVTKEVTRNRLSMLGSASLEPTLSFSLFGNKYDLDVLPEQPEKDTKEEKKEEEKTGESNNPHILTEIFQGFEKLDSERVSIGRDGSLVPKKKRQDDVTNVSGNRDDGTDSSKQQNDKRKCQGAVAAYTSSRSKVPKLTPSSSNSSERHSITRASNCKQTENGTQRGLPTSSNQNPVVKSPSLDEIRRWRSLIDKNRYKRMADINSVKSFKIPKRAKVENSEIPCSSKELSISSGDRRKVSGNNYLKHAGKEDVDSLNQRVKMNNITGSKGTVIRRSGTGSEPTMNRGFNDRLNTGRSNRIPSRLTPNIHNAFPSVRKDNMGSKVCTKQENSKSESKNITDVNGNGGNRNGHRQIANERSFGSIRVSKDEFLDKNKSTNSGKDVVSNKGLVNGLRVNGSRDKKSHTRNVDYLNENSRVVKERRNFVMKKILELDSDDGESTSDFASESSLLEMQNASREKTLSNPGRSENQISFPFEQKGVLDAIPKHHSGLSHHYLESVPTKRPIDNNLPNFMQNAMISEPSVVGNSVKKTLSGSFLSIDGRSQSFENGELKMLKTKEQKEHLKKQEVAASEAKKALKPYFKNGVITKEEYKLILKRSVKKVVESQRTTTSSRVERLILKYVYKLKGMPF